MTAISALEEKDIGIITEIAIKAFEEDKKLYGAYPPLIDIKNRRLRFIRSADTFVIDEDGEAVGAALVFSRGKECTLGAIFIDPEFQGRGIGSRVLILLEGEYPESRRWKLDTPYLSVKNQRFYEKHGYVKTGEETPDPDSGFRLFLYEKRTG